MSSSTKPKILSLLGLNAAGKTTILYRLKSGDLVDTEPTKGFNVETIVYRQIKLTLWDFRGPCQIFFAACRMTLHLTPWCSTCGWMKRRLEGSRGLGDFCEICWATESRWITWWCKQWVSQSSIEAMGLKVCSFVLECCLWHGPWPPAGGVSVFFCKVFAMDFHGCVPKFASSLAV